MKRIVTFILHILLLLASTQAASAQAPNEEPAATYTAATVFAGITFTQPLGSFRQAYPGAGAFGGTIGVLVNPWQGPSPLQLGAQFGYLTQGNTLNRTSPGTFFSTMKTVHNLVPVHLVARVKPVHTRMLTPYLDCLAGATVFYTRSKIKEDLFDFLQNEHQAFVLSKYNKTIMSYGIGGGILVTTGKADEMQLDVRVVYLQGPHVQYVQQGHVQVLPDGYPQYRFTRSETSMLLVQLNLCGLLKM